MKYNQSIKPHIDAKLVVYLDAQSNHNEREAFATLEDAHVIGQHSTYYHCLIHYKMLRHGLENPHHRKRRIAERGHLRRRCVL